jgi:hypothetical protein
MKSDNTFVEGDITFELMRFKGDMFAMIDDLNSEKRTRSTIGSCTASVTATPTALMFPNRLTPSLAQIGSSFNASDPVRTKEVQEFTSTSEYPYPHVSYVNNYYFYLQKADLSGLPNAASHRNICIEVKFLDNDDDPAQQGMPVIYGKATDGAPFIRTYYSAVNYHAESPKLIDEVAIKLPIQVNEKHHILITYYHVTCKPPKGSSKGEIVTPVAYTVVKLLKDHQYVQSPSDTYH